MILSVFKNESSWRHERHSREVLTGWNCVCFHEPVVNFATVKPVSIVIFVHLEIPASFDVLIIAWVGVSHWPYVGMLLVRLRHYLRTITVSILRRVAVQFINVRSKNLCFRSTSKWSSVSTAVPFLVTAEDHTPPLLKKPKYWGISE